MDKKINLKRINIKNKKTLCISIITVIFVGVIIFGIRKSFALSNEDILKDQLVDGLSFEQATLTYKDGVTKYTVEVHNDGKNDYSLKYIEISFQTDDNIEIIKLYGYIGDIINSKETKYMDASIDREIIGATKVVYSIKK